MRSGMLGLFKQRRPNGIDHGISFLQHLIVPKPEDFEASLTQALPQAILGIGHMAS
jgi:hypothetical protein